MTFLTEPKPAEVKVKPSSEEKKALNKSSERAGSTISGIARRVDSVKRAFASIAARNSESETDTVGSVDSPTTVDLSPEIREFAKLTNTYQTREAEVEAKLGIETEEHSQLINEDKTSSADPQEAVPADVTSEQLSNNPVEDFDLLGRTEAIEAGHPIIISHSLNCFPDSLRVTHCAQGGDVVDWWKLIKSNSSRWEISVWREPSGDIKITFDFPREDYFREENGILFDSRFATVNTRLQEDSPVEEDQSGFSFSESTQQEEPLIDEDSTFLPSLHEAIPVSDIQLNADSSNSGWKIAKINDSYDNDWHVNLPDADDNHVVRGINDEEMIASLKTGVIQSRGDVVNDVGQKSEKNAWTYFYPGSYIEGAFGYAAHGRIFCMPTFSKPAYVVSMKRTENIKDGRGDLYSTEPLSIDDIERIYEIRPISIEGNLSIHINRLESPESGIQYSLSKIHDMDYPKKIVYAFKEVSPDEVRKSLKVNKEPIASS